MVGRRISLHFSIKDAKDMPKRRDDISVNQVLAAKFIRLINKLSEGSKAYASGNTHLKSAPESIPSFR